jgi:hypothetical protein
MVDGIYNIFNRCCCTKEFTYNILIANLKLTQYIVAFILSATAPVFMHMDMEVI